MYNRFCEAINRLRRGEKGITGLETAIILIAFVTVASVLAYSVLSAGIFSSERGKAAVYSGLSGAESSMTLKGSVVGTADMTATPPNLKSVTFNLALAISGDSVDLSKIVMNYWDDTMGVTALTLDTAKCGTSAPTTTAGDWSYALSDGTDSAILSGTTTAVIVVYLPGTADVESYQTCTLQINPPTGASITLQRTMPPIAQVMTLN